MIVIADIIGEVVSKVSQLVFNDAAYSNVKTAIQQQLSSNVNQITYLHGHPLEVINTLRERNETTNELVFKKYPLITMFQDIAESPVNGMMEATLQIIIATSTEQHFKVSQRYNTTFKPILLPLYHLLLEQLNKHKSIKSVYTFDHQKYDRVFWGTIIGLGIEGRMFDDYLDAVELQNLKITFFENNC